ncbi:hypothetical protein KDW69_28260 [Burkholderia ambifaria]|uniref:hypothetical protein n=1 Tax=Burkholderia ambifaria TaxID=152480 RepID=UPI001B903642|nr:hypothetical protein [Burkholderia ambifaria]MBR8335547.1 hypothetical protein [Burkholderia ambifaria]
MSASIQLKLDGGLLHGPHSVTVRTLGRSMTSMQAAVDRAFLDIQFGQVFKHARLPIKYYADADFVVGEMSEGSFVIDFLSERGGPIVRRLIEAISNPYKEAVEGAGLEIYEIGRQIEGVKAQVLNEIVQPQPYEDFLNSPDPLATRAYGDRSITKNIDHMLTPVRKIEDASLKLSLKASEQEGVQVFDFDSKVASEFSDVVTRRKLGGPVIFNGSLRALDRGHRKSNFKGKFTNFVNGKDLVLHIQSEEDLVQLVPYLNEDELTIVACPIIEYDAFDPNAGDIQFLSIVQ